MRSVVAALLLISFTGGAIASRVDNFVLLDHQGDAHELYYHREASAVVFMVHGNDCPSTGDSVADYKALRDQFEPLGAKFFMLNSSIEDQRASIAEQAQRYAIDMPVLDDETQLIGESLGTARYILS